MPFSESTEPIISSIPPDDQSGEPSPFAGVNKLLDPRRISDAELVNGKNLFPVSPLVMSHRGVLNFGGYINLDQTMFPCNASVVPFAGTYDVALVRRNVGNSSSTKLALALLNGGTTVDGTGVGVTGKKPCLTFFQQNVIMVPGAPYTAHCGRVYTLGTGFTALALQDAAGTEVTPAGASCFAPQVAAPYHDRMVYANFGPGFDSYLLFSDSLFKSTISPGTARWLTVSLTGGKLLDRAIQIGGNADDDRIVGLKEVMLTAVGGIPQTGLLILREYSAFLATGEPNETTDNASNFPPIGNLNIARVAYNCGCSSQETIVTTPYGTIWAGPDDVWLFAYGQAPIRIGTKIRSVLQRTPASKRYRWHASYFNGIYRLALDTSTNPADDDPCGEQWWLDMRSGPPQGSSDIEIQNNAQWWGPHVFKFATSNVPAYQTGTHNIFAENRQGVAPTLNSLEFAEVTGPAAANAVATYDNVGDRDSTSDLTALAILNQVGTEVQADLSSKEYDLGDPRAEKLLQGVEAAVNATVDSIINVDVIMDTVTVETISKGIPALDPITNIDPPGMAASRITQPVQWFPGSRDIGKTFQLRLYDPTPGVAIVAGSNDTIVFANSLGKYYVVSITPRMYADVHTVLQAFAAAMSLDGMTFSATISSNLQRLTLTGPASNFFPGFNISDIVLDSPGTNQPALGAITAAQYRSTVKIFNMAGWTTTNGTGGTGTALTSSGGVLTANNIVPSVNAQNWEVSSLAMNVLPFPRRPT